MQRYIIRVHLVHDDSNNDNVDDITWGERNGDLAVVANVAHILEWAAQHNRIVDQIVVMDNSEIFGGE